MPIYEYQCQQCGERSEVLQRISDAPLTECKTCGGELKKLISAPAFQFKGSGWYVTDYARQGQGGKDASGGGEGGSKSDSSGSSSSEAGSSSSDTSSSAKGDSGGSSKDSAGSKSTASSSS